MPPSAPRGSRQQRRSLRCSPRAKLCPELPCLVQLLGAHTVTPCSHSAASEGQRLQPSPRAPTAKHEPTPKLSGPAEPRALMSSSRTDPLAAPAPQPVCNSSCNPNPPRAAQLGFLSVWVTFSPQRPGMWQHLFPPPPFRQGNGLGRFPPPHARGQAAARLYAEPQLCGEGSDRGTAHTATDSRAAPGCGMGTPQLLSASALCLCSCRPVPLHRTGGAARRPGWGRQCGGVGVGVRAPAPLARPCPSPRCAVTLVLKPALCEAVRPQLALGRRGGCFKGPIHGASPLCLPPRPRWGLSHAGG